MVQTIVHEIGEPTRMVMQLLYKEVQSWPHMGQNTTILANFLLIIATPG